MRWSLTLGLMTALTIFPAVPVWGEEDRPATLARPGEDKSSVIVSNPGAAEAGEPAGRRGRRPLPKGELVTLYGTRWEGEGEPCLYSVTTRREAPLSAEEQFRNDNLTGYVETFGMPMCDGGNDPVPGRVAQAFVRTIPLPAPRPHIAPDGTAITGLPAYLETNGSLLHEVPASDTPLGAITVQARSTYWVDWGDGTPEAGPFAFEGEAYPTGKIFHHYQYKGAYTVTVHQAWTATWRLGSDEGTIEGLRTEASIPLQVGELQAVIR